VALPPGSRGHAGEVRRGSAAAPAAPQDSDRCLEPRDSQLTIDRVARCGNGTHGLLDRTHHAAHVLDEDLAALGQSERPAVTPEQDSTGLLFENPQLLDTAELVMFRRSATAATVPRSARSHSSIIRRRSTMTHHHMRGARLAACSRLTGSKRRGEGLATGSPGH